MVLPFELTHLDQSIVRLLFESLTEEEIMPELGSYDLATVRNHLIALIELGYVQGEIFAASHVERTARPRCLTIKGYTLFSRMNAEQGKIKGQTPLLFRRSAARGWTVGA